MLDKAAFSSIELINKLPSVISSVNCFNDNTNKYNLGNRLPTQADDIL